MTASTLGPVSIEALLRLGRVSNLPTVWTNVLAATTLAGGDPFTRGTGSVLLAMSLFYIGGMYLNDAFDREIDARERPTRPIPAGLIAASWVFCLGYGMLALGVLIMALHGPVPGLAGAALAGAIVAYDANHKGNPLSPIIMGLCRALVYVGAGAAASGTIGMPAVLGAVALVAHVIGLTYAAKQESLNRIDALWPLAILAVPLALAAPAAFADWWAALAFLALAATDVAAIRLLAARTSPGAVPRAVSELIAAISLVDALLIAAISPVTAGVCAAGYVATHLLQRVIPGT
jgi:4-hydroxybenzoate polyprenyltransferase